MWLRENGPKSYAMYGSGRNAPARTSRIQVASASGGIIINTVKKIFTFTPFKRYFLGDKSIVPSATIDLNACQH